MDGSLTLHDVVLQSSWFPKTRLVSKGYAQLYDIDLREIELSHKVAIVATIVANAIGRCTN